MTLSMRALSIRQPWAELIMRRLKTVEYRSRFTRIRGRVYVYASLGGPKNLDPDTERFCKKKYGVVFLPNGRAAHCLDYDRLPRGVLVGTVEVVDCQGEDGKFEWHLRKPERALRLLKPKKHPQPGFFYPF